MVRRVGRGAGGRGGVNELKRSLINAGGISSRYRRRLSVEYGCWRCNQCFLIDFKMLSMTVVGVVCNMKPASSCAKCW